jgi:hypothetical protein
MNTPASLERWRRVRSIACSSAGRGWCGWRGRQRVVVGERGDALARERDLGDVAADAAVAGEHAVGAEARLAAHREEARAAVGHDARELEVAERQVAVEHRHVRRPAGLVGARRGHAPGVLADDAAADLRRAVGAVHDAGEAVLLVRLPEEVRRQVGEAPEALLALAQHLLGLLPLQELAEQAADRLGGFHQALVGLARAVAGEGEQADGAALRHRREGEGGERAAGLERRLGEDRLAALPGGARAAEELLGGGLAREPAFFEARSRRSGDPEAAARSPSPRCRRWRAGPPAGPRRRRSACARARATACSRRSSCSPRFCAVMLRPTPRYPWNTPSASNTGSPLSASHTQRPSPSGRWISKSRNGSWRSRLRRLCSQ